MAKIADLDTASEHLQLAFGRLSKSVEGMRDLQAEREGEEGNRAREAEAKLGLALQEERSPFRTNGSASRTPSIDRKDELSEQLAHRSPP